MKKKIIFVAFCLILFLIFTALGYGGPDPKKMKEHPWGHMLSPKPDNDQNLNFVVLVINPHFYLMFKSPIKVENSNSLDKFPDLKSASPITQGSLNKNETMSGK
jgi:hypothetical protein